ncbi:MAG: T9SS type A sorting domain-containing protein [Sphingobacteriales bacterium]|nr:T9SS type A sorting domain-containing protein [Sphingobacteriales bacterium]MCC7224193.1 T9SS type A sorting domain-containing protein [Chitinophagales bacterium]
MLRAHSHVVRLALFFTLGLLPGIRGGNLWAQPAAMFYDNEAICWAAGLAFKAEASPQHQEVWFVPNPAQEQVSIVLPRPLADNAVLTLYDALGQKVREMPLKGGQTHYVLSTNGMANGLYLTRVGDGNGMSLTGKLSIVH